MDGKAHLLKGTICDLFISAMRMDKADAVYVVVLLIVLGAIAFYFVPGLINDDSKSDSGLNPRSDVPLDGTFILTGSSTISGVEYYSYAKFVFDDGELISKEVNTNSNKSSIPSGVTIHTSSMKYIDPVKISPDNNQPYVPNAMNLHDSMVYHNPFLKGMTVGKCGYIDVNGKSTEVHAFDDNGKTYYLDKNGNLIGYKYQYNGTDLLAILA